MDKELNDRLEKIELWLARINEVLERINEQVYFTYKKHGDKEGLSDVLANRAKSIALEAGAVSTALLQRNLRIGYMRAKNLIDILEADGIIGPPDGAKPRNVL
jgi:S-DNA-T family DNA segregation ATPase FtsK/SpoIIIE